MLEFATTLANVATLVVLLCGAVAATVQLRHVRAGNELAALLAIERTFAEPELQAALLYVQRELAERLREPAYRAELVVRGYVDPRRHPEMSVCNWFDEMGTMVAGHFLDEDIFLDSFGRLVEYYWKLLMPAVALLRRERGPGQYESFEQLAAVAERWRARHREGIYAGAFVRLPIADPWADIDRAPAHGAR